MVPEGHAVITVTDTGVGIAPADLPKIFEPGFTTKGVRVGSGLGLAIVKRVIEEHEGAVRMDSREGEGSTVTLRIPLKP